MDTERQFRASTDQMLDMLDRLRAVEEAKQAARYGSAEFVQHAAEADRLSRMVFRWAGMQLQMAESAARAVERGEQSPAPLVTVTPRPLDRILANWREAQLRLEISKPGSPEAAAATEQVERLREEFHAAQDEKLLMTDWHDAERTYEASDHDRGRAPVANATSSSSVGVNARGDIDVQKSG